MAATRNPRRTREERRLVIERAALRLYERRGYAATHMTHIAEEAGVSRRTVFRYFNRKEDTVFGDYATDREHLLEALRMRPPGEPTWTALHAAMATASRYLDREVVSVRARVVLMNQELLPRATEITRDWIGGVAQELAARAGESTVSARSRLAANVAFSVFSEAIVRWSASNSGMDSLPAHLDAAFADTATLLSQKSDTSKVTFGALAGIDGAAGAIGGAPVES